MPVVVSSELLWPIFVALVLLLGLSGHLLAFVVACFVLELFWGSVHLTAPNLNLKDFDSGL
jgi:hypothetical protein